jgi:hypothetical protein
MVEFMKNIIGLLFIFSIQTFAQSGNILTITQMSDYEIVSTVENNAHFHYGFSYPLTYQMTIPSGVSDLRAFSKEKPGDEWKELEVKTADEFFNGINAVRFDYDNAAEDYFHQHLDYISKRKNIWYAATGHLYLYHFAQIHTGIPVDIAENAEVIPKSMVLHQNYPNPFNPITVINYELPIANYVELNIFNLLGQKVASLVSEEQKAGDHQIQWDASDMTSGVYYYQIRTDEFIETKKMVLLQ